MGSAGFVGWSQLRRRWRSVVLLTVLIGVVGGASDLPHRGSRPFAPSSIATHGEPSVRPRVVRTVAVGRCRALDPRSRAGGCRRVRRRRASCARRHAYGRQHAGARPVVVRPDVPSAQRPAPGRDGHDRDRGEPARSPTSSPSAWEMPSTCECSDRISSTRSTTGSTTTRPGPGYSLHRRDRAGAARHRPRRGAGTR